MSQKECSDDVVKEWFGQLPKGWLLCRLRTLGHFMASGIDKKTVEGEQLVRMVNYTDVYGNSTLEIHNSLDYMIVSCSTKKIEEHGLVQGDMLFTPSSETPQDIGVSVVVTEDMLNTVYSYHLTRFRIRDKISLHYRKYLCNHPCVLRQFSRVCKGTTRQILVREDFKSAWVAIPPTEQQDRISGYLNEQTAKIDRLMEMRRRQMTLLKEQRAALIQQAVTRGLNPNAPMKDSGLPWMSEIPTHWRLTKAKFVSEIFVPQRNKPDLNKDDGYYWVTMEEMTRPIIDSAAYRVSDAALTIAGSRILPSGSVIASCVGNFGSASINDVPIVINQQLQAFIPHRINAEFLRLVITISASYFEMIATAATLVYVNQDGFANLPVPLPPLDEQTEILSFVEEQQVKFDALHATYASQLTLLAEYRAALIHECVTGQRTVPEVANA